MLGAVWCDLFESHLLKELDLLLVWVLFVDDAITLKVSSLALIARFFFRIRALSFAASVNACGEQGSAMPLERGIRSLPTLLNVHQVLLHLIQFHAQRLSLRTGISLYEAEDFGEVAPWRLFYNGLDLLQGLVLFFVMLDGVRDLLHLLLGHPLLVICIGNIKVFDLLAVLDLVDAMLLVLPLLGFVKRLYVDPV